MSDHETSAVAPKDFRHVFSAKSAFLTPAWGNAPGSTDRECASAEGACHGSLESRFQRLRVISIQFPGALPQASLESALSALNRYPFGGVLSGFSSAASRANALRTAAKRPNAFTLAELLVSVGVLVLLTLLATQLLNSAATITTLGHKQIDADSQARELFDRMAIDFAQMVKRSDVDYYLKAPATASDCAGCSTQAGNDQIAFYSTVPGYYPSGSVGSQQSPVSIIGYRMNVSGTTLSNKMERLGAGLVWNGATSD